MAGTLPTMWSSDRNIEWQTELDGYGQSAPVVAGGCVIVTSVIGLQKEQCAVTAYSLSGGNRLWQFRFDAAVPGPSTYMMSRAAPTPVVDAHAVYAFFESGDVAAVDLSGHLLWHRSLTADFGDFQTNHGLGSSPAQTADLVLLNIEHKGPSMLLALNKQSGETEWKADRPSGSSWTSPIVVGEGTSLQVIVSSGGTLAGYDTKNGQQLWCLEGLQGNSVPSPCAVGDFIFTGARIPEFGSIEEASQSNLCIRLTTDSEQPYELCWRAGKTNCDYASPVVAGEQVYYLNNVGVLNCLDALSGETVYQQRLRIECWATPIVADTGIYFFGKDGTTRIVRHGREFEILATNHLWDPVNPPKPEHYQEATTGGHGHGASSAAKSKTPGLGSTGTDTAGQVQATPGSRADGMLARLLADDRNKDGVLQADELNADIQPTLKRVDTNGDGMLDQAELKVMAESFARRREGSQAAARDPIVYGVAGVDGAVVVRTGTRLYCISSGVRSPVSAVTP